MIAPFYKLGLFGSDTSLIVAFVIGLGFGTFLERAGFGNARLLAAQFYFRDLRVLKVMFTAIVTAMVGLYYLSRLGWVDLSLVYLVPTFLVPQIVGGLLLGFGFVIGGYCPGTSCVSAATGRVDGIVYVLGMFAGLLGFGEVYPHFAGWTQSTPMGQLTLAKLFDVPYGLLVGAVVVMALGAFVAAEWAERKIGRLEPGAGALLEPVRRWTPVRRFAAALAGLGLLAVVAGNPYRGATATVNTAELARTAGGAERVSAPQLADWLIAGRNDFVLVDLRSAAAYAAYHLPDAINLPLGALRSDSFAHTDRILLCSDGEFEAAQAWFLLRSLGFQSVYLLAGGLQAWKDQVLFPLAPAAGAPALEQVDFARRAAIAAHFGGVPRAAGAAASPGAAPATPELPRLAPPPPPPEGAAPAPVHKKREGC